MTSTSKVTVGQSAPPFNCHAVVDGRIKEISLAAYTAANHWLILIFFPKAWSFICPTEIRAFSARLEEFLYSRSCAVAFASTDNEYSLKAWNAASEMEGGLGGVHVPLISDSNHALSRAYGVLIEELGVAQRALFIIDPKGVIRGITVNDADIGRSIDEAQRVLDALVFKDEFGEGCPVNWKKGDKGIDLANKTKVDGPVEVRPSIEVRKSWAEWARPKLNRAWSGASQRSVGSMISHNRFTSADGVALPTLSSFEQPSTNLLMKNGVSNEAQGPFLSSVLGPTSAGIGGGYEMSSPELGRTRSSSLEPERMETQMEQAMARQRYDNLQAAMANQRLESDVGVAN